MLLTEPDRLARNYVHQMLLVEEFERRGIRLEFIDRPMSDEPNDRLMLQIRGAVAEYERTQISERMRRGRQAKYRRGNSCRGVARRTGIGWMRNARVIRTAYAWTLAKRPRYARCLLGIWSREPHCTASRNA